MKNNKVIIYILLIIILIAFSYFYFLISPLIGNVETILLIIIAVDLIIISYFYVDRRLDKQVDFLKRIFYQYGFVRTNNRPHRFSKIITDPRLDYCCVKKINKYNVYAWPVTIKTGEVVRIVPYIFVEKEMSISNATVTPWYDHSGLFFDKLINKTKSVKFEIDIPYRKVLSENNDVHLWKLFDPILLSKVVDASEFIYIYINKSGVGFLILQDYEKNIEASLEMIETIVRN